MPKQKPSNSATPDIAHDSAHLVQAVERLLAPLARLALANGITFATTEELLKQAFVQEASALQPGPPGHGTVSRVSTTTGISRREVTRLLKPDTPARQTKPPVHTEIFARWTTDPAFRDARGIPVPLKRLGPAPSFEALAQSITKDVHPRSMLEELIRLGHASYDQETDTVTLTSSSFVPSADSRQMLDFLADNVGDHFDAAVANVLNDGKQHCEQAVFADELSAESVEALRPIINAQWQTLCDALVPAITKLIEADAKAGRPQNQRVRIGLYSFKTEMDVPEEGIAPTKVKRKGTAKKG